MAGSATNRRPEKDARKKEIIRSVRWRCHCTMILLTAALLSAGTGHAADTLEQLQQRFDHEHDGVRKAKQLRRLGRAEFDKEREAAKKGDFNTVGLEMEKYRDNVRGAFEALKQSHPDAEKHSSGYRELEIEVGEGIREVRDVILASPEQVRPPMQLVEDDLKKIDMELLRLLFPRRPGEQPLPPRAALDGNRPRPSEQTEKQT